MSASCFEDKVLVPISESARAASTNGGEVSGRLTALAGSHGTGFNRPAIPKYWHSKCEFFARFERAASSLTDPAVFTGLVGLFNGFPSPVKGVEGGVPWQCTASFWTGNSESGDA